MKRRFGIPFILLIACTAWAGGGSTGDHGGDMTHRMMMLVLQLGVILFAAKFGNLLFERLKMPGVLGEVCGGILLGPYALGGIAFPGFSGGLFPPLDGFPVSPELYGICSIAAVVLLFMVGLETDIALFVRYSVSGSLVGIGGVAVSFLAGAGITKVLSPMLFGHALPFLAPPCIFLGVISTATSVGITARILAEKRKIDSPEGVTILAGAVVDDVLGIIMLAIGLGVISASAAGGSVDWGHIGLIAGKAVGIWLAATIIGIYTSHRISFLLKSFRDNSSIAVLSLGLALILAGLFEEAGLAMIIGAYVTGLSLSRSDINHVIREKVDPIYRFLIPVFFTVMGMLVDLSSLSSRNVVVFGLIYTLVAVLAKVGGCMIPALLTNFNIRGALRVGVGMLPRGEVALIIAGIGLAAGVLTPEVFGVSIMMTVLTTLLAPPLLIALFKNPASGLRREANVEDEEPLSFTFPSEQTAGILVTKLMTAFRGEGFFVHTLSHSERMYQLRKEASVISFQQDGCSIVFECRKHDIPLVSAAMYEVLADLERTIRELRKPIDREAVGRQMQDTTVDLKERKGLAKYLSPALLTSRLLCPDRDGVVDELIRVLADAGQIRMEDIPQVRSAVMERERSMPTGMQYGIAIPHGKTDAVKSLVCAIGLHPKGVDFESIDGQPSDIVILTLSPRSGATPHMQFMSAISQCLDESGREALRLARTSEEMYDVIVHGRISELKARRKHPDSQQIRLANYMKPEWVTTGLTGYTKAGVVRELLALLNSNGVPIDIDAVAAEVQQREAEISTGLGYGVAIPHARTDAVDRLICAIGTHATGVDFDSDDGKPSRIIVLTLSPKSAAAPHLRFMAQVSRILSESGRERVMHARTRSSLWAALTGAEAEIDEGKTNA